MTDYKKNWEQIRAAGVLPNEESVKNRADLRYTKRYHKLIGKAFTAEEKLKLSAVQGPMQIKGRVDSVELLPTDGVVVGSVYLVGLQDSTDFEEFVCTEVSPEVKYESVGKSNVPQVQSDWNQDDTEAVDYIKNKPSIPSAQVQSDWNQNDNTKADYIKNKPIKSGTGTNSVLIGDVDQNSASGDCSVAEGQSTTAGGV